VPCASPWDNDELLREELFSIERLEQHAVSLAVAQQVTVRPIRRPPLGVRLSDNESTLLAAYRTIAKAAGEGRTITPAAEWLLDNYHLVDAQIREIRDDLPPGYYRQLPKLAAGPFAGYPRVLGVAWAFVAHTDSRFDPAMLRRFVRAYQRVQPLTIGELWAWPSMLKLGLIENLRRLAEEATGAREARRAADRYVARIDAAGHGREVRGGLGDLRIKIADGAQEVIVRFLLKTFCKSARYLSDLECVGQSVMDDVTFDWADDLCNAR